MTCNYEYKFSLSFRYEYLSDPVRNHQGILKEEIQQRGENCICTSIVVVSELRFGAENEVRTRDPQLGKLVLYQLSYSRLWCGFGWVQVEKGIQENLDAPLNGRGDWI